MLGLLTDFGSADIYVGQLHARAQSLAPSVPLIDVIHDLMPYQVAAAAHLLPALMTKLPELRGWMAVVDPGVGTQREVIAARLDGVWLVGPDNGLLSVAVTRANHAELFRCTWRPEQCSTSFHGRDVFLPLVLELLQGYGRDKLEPLDQLTQPFLADDLAQIIYVDHYGNLFTGLRAVQLAPDAAIRIGDQLIRRAGTFGDVAPGELFWYENSIGLAEIACNQNSAARLLGVAVGEHCTVVRG